MGDDLFPNLRRAMVDMARRDLPGITWSADVTPAPIPGMVRVRLARPWGRHDLDGEYEVAGDIGMSLVLPVDDNDRDAFPEWCDTMAQAMCHAVMRQLANTN